MPINVNWKDDRHDIIVKTYGGRWTPDELHASEVTLKAMIDSVNHRVDVIADMRITASYPSNTGSLFDQYIAQIHPRIGLIVVLGRELNLEMMRVLADKYSNFLRIYAFAKTPEEAEQTIADDRAGKRIPGTLPPVDKPL